MSNFFELCGNGRVDFFFSMSMHRDPKGRYAVDVVVSMNIGKNASSTALYHGLPFMLPFLHLGERMPNVFFVQVFDTERGQRC